MKSLIAAVLCAVLCGGVAVARTYWPVEQPYDSILNCLGCGQPPRVWRVKIAQPRKWYGYRVCCDTPGCWQGVTRNTPNEAIAEWNSLMESR